MRATVNRSEYVAHAAMRVGAANARRQWESLVEYDARMMRRRWHNRACAVLGLALNACAAVAFYTGTHGAAAALGAVSLVAVLVAVTGDR